MIAVVRLRDTFGGYYAIAIACKSVLFLLSDQMCGQWVYVFKVNLSLDGQKLGEISRANSANSPA